jgi:hypothetical protein
MSDLVTAFDRMVKAVVAVSIADSHMASAAHFHEEAQPKCGNCVWWMTARCHREYHQNGRRRGPSCNGLSCGKYVENSGVEELLNLERHEVEKARAALDGGTR